MTGVYPLQFDSFRTFVQPLMHTWWSHLLILSVESVGDRVLWTFAKKGSTRIETKELSAVNLPSLRFQRFVLTAAYTLCRSFAGTPRQCGRRHCRSVPGICAKWVVMSCPTCPRYGMQKCALGWQWKWFASRAE